MMTFEEFIDDTLRRAISGQIEDKPFVQKLRAGKDFIIFKHAGSGEGLKHLEIDSVIKDLLIRAIGRKIGSEAFDCESISYKRFLSACGRAGLSPDLLSRVKPYSMLPEYVRTGNLVSDEDKIQVLSSMNPRRQKRV